MEVKQGIYCSRAKDLENIFANTGGIIATHAEDEDIKQLTAKFGDQTDIRNTRNVGM